MKVIVHFSFQVMMILNLINNILSQLKLINTQAVDEVVSDKDLCVRECLPLESSESILECNNALELSDSEQDKHESLQLKNNVSHV